ncbi:TPA: hypothetical protein U1220_002189 [Streptococcus suis]|uniref:PhrA family quorum-sensing system peptide n=1 Tax=Streptococcus suis TaxID=1307 RepID=UPI002AADCBC8|nr:PhrA family quorum-sensing system peptide [Streptococcus suis]MDY7594485.1 PhrA family quorum-sensing system peptide [Streptococcus suis]HEM5039951.1 hypothetical protein [Streptococcus suis]HEM5050384.1 hypothetical protein [Streptococcus suis]
MKNINARKLLLLILTIFMIGNIHDYREIQSKDNDFIIQVQHKAKFFGLDIGKAD